MSFIGKCNYQDLMELQKNMFHPSISLGYNDDSDSEDNVDCNTPLNERLKAISSTEKGTYNRQRRRYHILNSAVISIF